LDPETSHSRRLHERTANDAGALHSQNSKRWLIMGIQVTLLKRGLDVSVLPELVGSKMRKELNKRLAGYAFEIMREKVPVRTGALKASIIKDLRDYEAFIGPTVPYAVYVEYGTRPHIIRPVNASVLAFKVGGRTVFTPIVRHPGTKARPFIRETVEEVKKQIPELWREIWEEEVE
jgi:HK97 gp10 family phage protein